MRLRCVPMAVFVLFGSGMGSAAAQTLPPLTPQEALKVVVDRALSRLIDLDTTRSLEIVSGTGGWSFVFGRFEEDAVRELEFAVMGVGEGYVVAGGSTEAVAGLGICVLDPRDRLVECVTGNEENTSMMEFRVETLGTYKAVMHVYHVEGDSGYAGMVVMRYRPR